MNYSNATFMKNQTYYTLHVWKPNHDYGKSLRSEYKREVNALKKFDELVKSGLYTCVMLRKEEVYLRTPTTEISSSSPMKKWEAA